MRELISNGEAVKDFAAELRGKLDEHFSPLPKPVLRNIVRRESIALLRRRQLSLLIAILVLAKAGIGVLG